MGFKKKKRGRLEGVTKNALLKKEGKTQKKKKKEGTPSNFRIKFLAPSFYIRLELEELKT